jgi:MoxR-like ATPase
LKRRCLHLYIDFPSAERELEIVRLKVPGITDALAGQVVEAVQRIRQLDLKKVPSISETLDWAKTLTLLNAERLDAEMVGDTLSVILKYEGDIRKAQEDLKGFLAARKEGGAAAAGDDKDLLH